MKAQIINSWEDISLNQFTELTRMQSETTDPQEFTKRALDYLYNEDVEQIPYTLYIAQINGLNQFFDKPIARMKVSKSATYNINGTTYVLDTTPGNFTTSQYIDFTTFAKDATQLVSTLTTVLIPQGHKYNDGYDMEAVRADLGSMPCSHALGIVNFFVSWSRGSIQTILRFLTYRIRRTGKETEKTRKLREEVETLSRLLASSPLS